MKTTFKKTFLMEKKSLLNGAEKEDLMEIDQEDVSLEDILMKTGGEAFCKVFIKLSGLTDKQKKEFAVHCSEYAIEDLKKNFPGENRPNDILNFAKEALKNPSIENKRKSNSAAEFANNLVSGELLELEDPTYGYMVDVFLSAGDAAYACGLGLDGVTRDSLSSSRNSVRATEDSDEMKSHMLDFVNK